MLKRGDVSLFYEEAPGGAPPLVLIHGWGGNHSQMAAQFSAFRSDHRVITVDLRGHGQSDKPEQIYNIPGFADDIAWICRELALDRPVIIGHSMGGAIALELAAEGTLPLAGIVILDTAVLPPSNVWAGVQPIIAALKTPNYRDVVTKFLTDDFFLPTDDPRITASIIQTMFETPRHVLASAFESIFLWDSEAAAKKCRVPALYIESTRPRGDVARFRRMCKSLIHGQVVDSGHYVQLQVPDQVNSMIRRFLAINVAKRG